MKGPDLSNDLFGVVLQFRKRACALMGDLSKMYHGVLIPEVPDQHVHHYLWRNMETERPSDVYVKMVLTFEDKPAPAMAQIALRKTAQEGEELHPKAAKVLKEDMYMDDICHSEDTVQETRKIAEDLDKTLKNGGFHCEKRALKQAIDTRKRGFKRTRNESVPYDEFWRRRWMLRVHQEEESRQHLRG